MGQFCSDDNRFTEEYYFESSAIQSEKEIVYAKDLIDWQDDTVSLAIDLFYPSQAIDSMEKRPFILFIHGGSFLFGDKSYVADHCKDLARRGFVTASLQYRLGHDISNPLDQLNAIYRSQQDAHAAMRFIVEEANTYGIDTSWLFIGGQSAGAVTSLGLNHVSQDEWEFVIPNVENKLGALKTSGNSLTHDFTLKGIINNWGSTAGFSMQAEEMIPIISFHGYLDEIVPIEEGNNGSLGSSLIDSALNANKVCSELHVDSAGEHGIYITSEGLKYRMGRISCFFKSIFCNECSSEFLNEMTPSNCASTSSINEMLYDNEMHFWPNPSKGIIQSSIKKGTISIYSINGSIVFTQNLASSNQIELESLNRGMYIYTIQTDDQTYSGKLFVE